MAELSFDELIPLHAMAERSFDDLKKAHAELQACYTADEAEWRRHLDAANERTTKAKDDQLCTGMVCAWVGFSLAVAFFLITWVEPAKHRDLQYQHEFVMNALRNILFEVARLPSAPLNYKPSS